MRGLLLLLLAVAALMLPACNGGPISIEEEPADRATAPPPAVANATVPQTPVSTAALAPTSAPAATAPAHTPTAGPTPTPYPTATPAPEQRETSGRVPAGTHLVGFDIQPGIYAGEAGSGIMDSCYWERLSALTRETSAIIANDMATGRFFVEVRPGDVALSTDCELVALDETGNGISGGRFPSELAPGTYLVGRDIQPGLYVGEAGSGIMDSCYWERLRSLTGEPSAIIANDMGTGRFFVQVMPGDFAITFDCAVSKAQ